MPNPLTYAAQSVILSLRVEDAARCETRCIEKTLLQNGSVAEGLGTGLQNRLHRFDSGRSLVGIADLGVWIADFKLNSQSEFPDPQLNWGMAKW